MDFTPIISKTTDFTREERLTAYWNFILENCRPAEVKDKMGDYVEKSVRKNGWRARWSCPCTGSESQDSLNALVEVVDVHPQSLSAEVKVVQPLFTHSEMALQDIQEMIQAKEYHIPLTELIPVFDGSEELDETLTAMEHVRFFYENLWREWDRDEDGDYPYVTNILENRLRLYYDMEQENRSSDFIRQYKVTYNNYKQKAADLKKLQKEMATSHSKQELDTSDALSHAQKTHELEDIVKLLQAMENQHMRNPHGSTYTENTPEVCHHDPVIMIVASRLTAEMTKGLPDESIVKHYVSLENAIGSRQENDTILIYNGRHHVAGGIKLKESLKISGVGDSTIIQDGYDTFLTSQSPELQISNIVFIQSARGHYILVVEKGRVILRNCQFHCVSNGIVVKRGAELVMQNCMVYSALNAGLTVEENSVVHVECSEICNNGINGNDGGIKVLLCETEPSTVALVENKILGNYGYGVSLVKDNVVYDVHEKVYGVHLSLSSNTIENIFQPGCGPMKKTYV